MRHIKIWKVLSVYLVVIFSQRAVAGSLLMPNLEYGASGAFSLNRKATSCNGAMEKNFSGLLGYSFSSCTALGAIPNSNPVGVQVGTLSIMRALLNTDYFDIYTAGSPNCPNSNATFNYMTLRARASDHNFDSDSAFSAGRVTYQSDLNKLVVEQRYSLSGESDSTIATYNGLMSCSGNSVSRMKVESGNPQDFNSLISLVFGESLSYLRSFGVGRRDRAPVMSILAPVQTLSSETFSSKADQGYSGLYTEWNKTGSALKRVIYAAPNDSTGLKFDVFQMAEGNIDDFSQKVFLGELDCSNLNSPTNGFCSGTFSKSGISEAGAARCLFKDNLNSQDLFFCEAQLPHSNPSLHLKQMATFQMQTTTRVKLAVVPSESCTVNGVVRAGCNLEPEDAEGEITVTIHNKTSKTTDIALGATPTDFTLPSSLANTSASFFQNGGECGSQLAAFSSCTITVKYAPQEEKVNSDFIRISYDKKDGTQNSVVNATGSVKTSKGLEAIEVTPSSQVVSGDQEVSFFATARFKSGRTQDVTNVIKIEAQVANASAVSVTQATSNAAARVLASETGNVTAVASFGAIQAVSSVQVVAAPLTPNAFSAELQSDNTSVLLSWQNGGNSEQQYQLAYSRNTAPANCNSGTVISASTLGQSLSYTLSSLVSGSTYHFKICGINSANALSAPASASVTTPVVGDALVATNGQVLNDGTNYSSITVPNGVTLKIGPSFSGAIGNLTVKSGGVLTASNSFSNSNPSADLFNLGNTHGRLYLVLAGDLTVESGGLITMDGKGYPGGGNGPGHNGSRAHGLSHSGYGATGAGLNYAPTANCYRTWRAGGGGGYGTSGGSGAPMALGGAGGASFGASDFTTKLYLGSGGAGGACWDQGGKGGGAIYIEASNIAVSGTVSARGTKPSTHGGGGSGGTIVLNALGSLSNTGTITTEGGTKGTSVNVGGTGRLKLVASSFESMSGSLVGVVPSSDSELRLANVALNENITTLTQSAYGASAVAKTGTILNMAALKAIMGAQAPSEKLDFKGAGHFDFNASLEQSGYDIVIGDQQHFYLNASWGEPRNVTVESGGVITANAYAATNPSSDGFNLSSTGKAYGNGRLIMDRIQGTFHVKAGGYVTMSGKGHLGGGNLPGNNGSIAHGQSPEGYGLGGAGRTVTGINCYHSYRYGSGASYGEVGGVIANGGAAGSLYGLADFDSELYLGSGGGGSGCWHRGGTGGGAIYVGAQNIINEGYIDASGRKAYHRNAGGGSGGTIVLNAASAITNSGKVNVEGGRGVMTYSLSQSSFYQYNGWNGVIYSDPWYLYDSRRGVGRGTNRDYQSWIQADMGSNQVVDLITISPHDRWPHHYLNDRLLQYHNGSTWVTYKTIAGTTLARDNYFTPNINARKWRIINPDNRRYQHILIGEFVLDSSAAPDSAFLANKGGKGRVKFNANSISSTGSIVGIVADAVPFITTQPVNRTAAEGQSAQFSVVAGIYDGSNPLYQWQVSTDNGANYSDIDGATSSSYTIASTSQSQNNEKYRVRVSAAGPPYSSSPSSMLSSAVNLTVTPVGTVEYLVVGGGGGGGGVIGGGGGGGGVLTGSKVLNSGELALVMVGQGGAGGWSWNSGAQAGQPGWSSRFSNNNPSVDAFNLGKTVAQWDVTALGGGRGGAHGGADSRTVGQSGASAGGSGNNGTIVAGTPGQGNAGGGGDSNNGGGGGGAGGAGETRVTSSRGGNGGVGIYSAITGQSICYGAGGAGGTRQGYGSGGTGGCSGTGGNGGTTDWSRSAGHGATNTGSGGGGGGHDGSRYANVQSAGNGGSGVVIIASIGQPLANISSGLTYTLDTTSRPGVWIYRFTAGSGTITK